MAAVAAGHSSWKHRGDLQKHRNGDRDRGKRERERKERERQRETERERDLLPAPRSSFLLFPSSLFFSSLPSSSLVHWLVSQRRSRRERGKMACFTRILIHVPRLKRLGCGSVGPASLITWDMARERERQRERDRERQRERQRDRKEGREGGREDGRKGGRIPREEGPDHPEDLSSTWQQ